MNLIEILENAPINGQDVMDMANTATNYMSDIDNDETPLKRYVQAKALMKCLEEFSELVKPHALEEVQKEVTAHQKTLARYGAKITVAELGTKWFYDKTNDPRLYELGVEKEKAAKAEKGRQEFLKKINGKLDLVTEDGEVVTIFPPYKQSTTGLKIEF